MNWEISKTKTPDLSPLTSWTTSLSHVRTFSLSLSDLFYFLIVQFYAWPLEARTGCCILCLSYRCCEPPSVSAGNWNQVLCKSSIWFNYWASLQLSPTGLLMALVKPPFLGWEAPLTVDSWVGNFSQTESPQASTCRRHCTETRGIPWLIQIPSLLENQEARLKSNVETTCWF